MKRSEFKYHTGDQIWFLSASWDMLDKDELPEILTGHITRHGIGSLYGYHEITCDNGDQYDLLEEDLYASLEAAEMAAERDLLSDVVEDIESLKELRDEIKQVKQSLKERRTRLQTWYKTHPQHCQRG